MDLDSLEPETDPKADLFRCQAQEFENNPPLRADLAENQ